MTPEELSQLRRRQWHLRAKPIRVAVSKVIADAIGESPSSIVFTDLDETEQIADLFSTQLRNSDEIELPNREAAIDFVTRSLSGITRPSYLLVEEYHKCGMVVLDFAKAIENLNSLLKCQYECFRLISASGEAGVCITVEEGSASRYPRYINLWRRMD
jgi:hypothetical protein